IPLLQNELRRAGCELSLEGRRVVDAFAIFQKMEPRTLSAAYKLYCGKSIENAHRAEADAKASFEVFDAQLARYAELPQDLAGVKIHEVALTLPWLAVSSLLDKKKALPNIPLAKIGRAGIPSTYVPGRNTVFLALAVSLADAVGAKAVVLGANALDYSGYPDC